MLQCVAVCCSVRCATHTFDDSCTFQRFMSLVYVLQCATVCDSVLHCVALCSSILQCVAVCCSILQCVRACCSVLQCVALCCSVLQSVAVCCACVCDVNCDIPRDRLSTHEFIIFKSRTHTTKSRERSKKRLFLLHNRTDL